VFAGMLAYSGLSLLLALFSAIALAFLLSQRLSQPLAVLAETAQALLSECGQAIRRLVGGLLMADWPEGTRRAVSFSFTPMPAFAASAINSEAVLAVLREAEGLTFDQESDEN